MDNVNYIAIAASAVIAFVISGGWYAIFGDRLAALNDAYADGRPAAATAAVELVRNLVVAVVFVALAEWAGMDGLGESIGLGVVAWVGFPVVILSGSVFHERVPGALAAIHAGDWLLKLVVIAAVVGFWS